MNHSVPHKNESISGPWWKYGYVWLVVGGPLAVVIAGIATLVIAIQTADVVVNSSQYQERAMRGGQNAAKSMAPAQSLRNHSVTPDEDLPVLDPK